MYRTSRMNGMGYGRGRGSGRGRGMGSGRGLGRGLGRGMGQGAGRGLGLRRRDGSCSGLTAAAQDPVETGPTERIQVPGEEAERLRKLTNKD